MKLCFIFNPCSGRHRRNARLLPLLRDFIAARSLDATLVATDGPGHATELAREAVAAGCLRIVAVGGDGTMNEVAQALLRTPSELAMVPCGSGNGLALHLCLARTPLGALELAAGADGRTAEVDTGVVNGHPFFNAMGLGFDAEVAQSFNRLTRRGLPAYTATALRAFNRRKTERCVISTGNRREEFDSLLIAVANSDQYGNRAMIAPGARVDDGVLDLVAVGPVGLFSALDLGARLFLGSIDRSRHVRRLRGSRFVIQRPAAGVVHTDGEVHQTGGTLEISILPRSLRVLVPSESPVTRPAEDRLTASFALQLP